MARYGAPRKPRGSYVPEANGGCDEARDRDDTRNLLLYRWANDHSAQEHLGSEKVIEGPVTKEQSHPIASDLAAQEGLRGRGPQVVFRRQLVQLHSQPSRLERAGPQGKEGRPRGCSVNRRTGRQHTGNGPG